MLIGNSLTQVKKNIETRLHSYRYLLYQTFSDDTISNLIREFETGDPPERAIIKKTLRSRFFSLAFNMEEIQAITFIWNDLDVTGYVKGIGDFSDSPFSRMNTKQMLYAAGKAQRRGTVIPTMPMQYMGNPTITKNLFHLVLPFYDFKERRLLGVFTLSIDENVLRDICSEMNDSLVFILGPDGKILSFPVASYLGTGVSTSDFGAFVERTGIIRPGRLLVNQLKLADPDWTIVSIANREAFFGEVDALQRMSYLLDIGFIAISLLVIILFTRSMYTAISELVSVMRRSQGGDFAMAESLEKRHDELSLLAKGYDEMIEEIRGLMRNLEQEKDNVYAATQRQKESEIRALEAQINPHFLYNTLDCINWMAIDRNELDISDMLSKLGSILRYGISGSNSLVSVKDEVEWLRQYVFLQRVRFGEAFKANIEVETEAESFPIYKLLMQPFIENSIIHGFSNTEAGGMLSVRIGLAEDDMLLITIRDNGHGMSTSELSATVAADSSHIGIKNAIERVAVYYGERGGVRIESERGQGTCVTIRLPKVSAWA